MTGGSGRVNVTYGETRIVTGGGGGSEDVTRAKLVNLALRYHSQRMLARDLGVSQGLVSLMLAGKRAITPDIAAKIDASYRAVD